MTEQEIIAKMSAIINSHCDTEGIISTISYLLSLGFTQQELELMNFNKADIQLVLNSSKAK